KAYGTTTLESNHVKVSGDKVEFNFIGKKGVKITQEVQDSKVAEIVKDKKGKLFDTDCGKVRSYLKKIDGGFKPKDFRTYVATSMAAALVKMRPTQPKTEKERKQTIKEIATLVSRKLGNTPAMAQKSYIAPEVFDRIRIGG
ncbi:MAG: hypothetical protein Q8K85_09700, partial [Hyphomicrobium sp.]|nr:hypothetical protein [Hyphomicrobium sp.]